MDLHLICSFQVYLHFKSSIPPDTEHQELFGVHCLAEGHLIMLTAGLRNLTLEPPVKGQQRTINESNQPIINPVNIKLVSLGTEKFLSEMK